MDRRRHPKIMLSSTSMDTTKTISWVDSMHLVGNIIIHRRQFRVITSKHSLTLEMVERWLLKLAAHQTNSNLAITLLPTGHSSLPAPIHIRTSSTQLTRRTPIINTATVHSVMVMATEIGCTSHMFLLTKLGTEIDLTTPLDIRKNKLQGPFKDASHHRSTTSSTTWTTSSCIPSNNSGWSSHIRIGTTCHLSKTFTTEMVAILIITRDSLPMATTKISNT